VNCRDRRWRTGRHVARRNHRLGEALRRQPERGETVRIEVDLDLARPPSFEVDARDALDPRQARLDDLLHELLVLGRDVGNRVARQRTHLQRPGVLGSGSCRRRNTCGSSASGGSGGKVLSRETTSSMTRVMSVPISNLSPTLPKPRFDSERISTSPGIPRIAFLDRLDQRLLDLGGRGLTPRRVDEELWLPRIRQQLYRQAQQCEGAEQQDDGGRRSDGSRVLGAAFCQFHRLLPTDASPLDAAGRPGA
jgi:hypothetical protein